MRKQIGQLMAGVSLLVVLGIASVHAQEVIKIDLPEEEIRVSEQLAIEINVENADEVQVFVQPADTQELISAGTAEQGDDGLWRLNWQVRDVENGPHTLLVKALDDKNNVIGVEGRLFYIGVEPETEPIDENPEPPDESPDPDVDVISESPDAEPTPIQTEIPDPDAKPATEDEPVGYETAVLAKLEPVSLEEAVNIDQDTLRSMILDQSVTVEQAGFLATDQTNGKLTAVRLAGRAKPNSTVTLYVHSDPQVFTLETNEFGNWVYTIEDGLPSGRHEVYISISDGGQKHRSEIMSFLVPEAYANGGVGVAMAKTPVSTDASLDGYLWMSLGMIAAVGMATAVVMLIQKKRAS